MPRSKSIQARGMKTVLPLVLPMAIVACSSAGFEGYGPRDEGFVGNAYGYADRQVETDLFYVDYVDVYGEDARSNAIRRARELCVEAGFSKQIIFSPSTRSVDGLLMAYGIAQCQERGQRLQLATEALAWDDRESIEARLEEIDAEMTAYEQRLGEVRETAHIASQPGDSVLESMLDLAGGAVAADAERELRSLIESREIERAVLESRLTEMRATETESERRRAQKSQDPVTASRESTEPRTEMSRESAKSISSSESENAEAHASQGCVALMRQHETDQAELGEAFQRWMDGSDNVSVCGSSVIMRNLLLDAAEVVRQCPEGDPTGEQLAAFEQTAESHKNNARHMCGDSAVASRRYSKEEMLEILRDEREF